MTSAGFIYAWLSVATGTYMLLFSLANILYLRWVTRRPKVQDGPLVSVLIPARNEAARIGPTLKGLAEQDYANFEIIILDDNSDDGTWKLVCEAIKNDNRFQVIRGKKLPKGWKGKPYAMQQLYHAAKGEICLFLDADMRPNPQLLSWTVTNMEHHRVHFLSGYPRHTTPVNLEYLLFPVMYMATAFLLPLWLFRKSKTYMFSHAIGQFFCVRTKVLAQINGFEPVKNKINEDIQIARFLKGSGYQQVFLDAKEHLSGNMYDSMDHARMGIMRVVYEYFDNLIYPFIFMGLVMSAFLILPIPLVVAAAVLGLPWAVPLAISVVLVLAAWMLTLMNRKMPWYVALLYPINFIWTIVLSVHSIILSKKGKGYQWKGRTVL